MAVARYKCGEKECGSAAGRRKKGDGKLQRENLFLTKHWVESVESTGFFISAGYAKRWTRDIIRDISRDLKTAEKTACKAIYTWYISGTVDTFQLDDYIRY